MARGVGSRIRLAIVFSTCGMAIASVVLMISREFDGSSSTPSSSPLVERTVVSTPEIVRSPKPPPPPKKRVLKLVYVETIWNEATMYTKECDGGSWDRTTSSNNFDSRYPKELKTLRHTIENEGAICAPPWKHKKYKDDLIEINGRTIQRHRVRFPWVDPPGHTRIPCDRVPYRDKWGNLLPQRNYWDIFVHMPKRQARLWGHPMMPIEIYRWEWREE